MQVNSLEDMAQHLREFRSWGNQSEGYDAVGMFHLLGACLDNLRKNATKAVTIVTTRATAAKTTALAVYKVARLGIAVSDVLIIPVEYSAVSTIAPSTTMTSWPRKKSPAMLTWVASKVARSEALVCDQLAATPAEMAAPIPTLIANKTSSVQ